MLYILNGSYSPNTAVTNRTLAYLRGLSELGVQTKVCFFFPDEKRSKIVETYPNISVVYFWDRHISRNTVVKGIRYIQYIQEFKKALNKEDKVYLYNMEDVMEILLRKKGIEIFIERGEHPTIYPLGSKLIKPSLKRFFRDLKKVKGLFVVSNALKDFFVNNGVPQNNIKVINIIVDSNRFSNIRKDSNIEKYIAYCGTASNNKDGVDELIRAFAIVSKSHPDLKLYIIGKTPLKEDESGNFKLIDELRIKDKVVFTGVVSASDIPKLLINAVALALDRPANIQAKYGFPTKLGEYLLTKNPVVITKVGDIPCFLKDNVTAYLTEPQDPKAFAEKLNYILDNPYEAEVVGRNGYELAMREFNYLTETKKLVDFIFHE